MNSPGPGPWLTVRAGSAPLLLCMPHTGTDIPPQMEPRFASPWLARKDTDWWIERLYAFAEGLGASLVRTALSRSVIDANRDPTGASLYPGQATELCPTTTFDGEPLYRDGATPAAAEIAQRRQSYFEPYHRAVSEQIARLALRGTRVWSCMTVIRSARRSRACSRAHCRTSISAPFPGPVAPRSPHAAPGGRGDASEFSRVTNGRFKGGYTTRHYGAPAQGVHAVQMELACRGYLRSRPGRPRRTTGRPVGYGRSGVCRGYWCGCCRRAWSSQPPPAGVQCPRLL